MYSVKRPFPSGFPAVRHLINGKMSPVIAGCAGHFGTTYQLIVRVYCSYTEQWDCNLFFIFFKFEFNTK